MNQKDHKAVRVEKEVLQAGSEAKGEAAQRGARGVTRVLSFSSGKGGVGKTHTVTNVGIALAAMGSSVLILDADLGLANVDVLLNLKPKGNLYDVLQGRAKIDDIILEGPGGVSIIPAASGVDDLQALNAGAKLFLLQEIERIAYRFEYLLIDTPAGIGSDVLYFNSAAEDVVVVINGEPTSLTDAYALIKVLSASCGERRVSVVVNNVATKADAQRAFTKLSSAVERFLRVEVRLVGWIPTDPAVRDCVMQQRAVVAEFPTSRAALAIAEVARSLDDERLTRRVKGGMQFFFQQLLEVSAYGEAAVRAS